jgi:hypothetical protein
LAALPSAVENGLISYSAALALAEDAAQRVSELLANSAEALTPAKIEMYGYRGMLFHCYVWNEVEAEFRCQPGTEISSIDTTLLMYGLLVSANYFGGQTRAAYEALRPAEGIRSVTLASSVKISHSLRWQWTTTLQTGCGISYCRIPIFKRPAKRSSPGSGFLR